MKSEIFSDIRHNIDDVVAINIRNGDFLDPRICDLHDCFDRTDYLKRSISDDSIFELSKATIFSDDLGLCRKLYDHLLHERFAVVEYDEGGDVLGQFRRLTMYKNKIIWNSTFSFWSSFISDVIHNYSGITIVPSKFTKDEFIQSRANPRWTIV